MQKYEESVALSKATKFKLVIPALYLCLAVAYFAVSWPSQLAAHHVAGVSLTIVAFGLWLLARVQLGNAFSLAPKASYLVKTGLYAKLRHPVYYFSILALIGLGLYIWQLPAVVPIAVLIALESVRIRQEEAVLMRTFGQEYVDYRSKTWF